MNSSGEDIFDHNFEDLELHYKYQDLDSLKRRSKHDLKENGAVNENEKQKESSSKALTQVSDIDEDIIPLSKKIIYCLPAFTKISCIVILNIHALLFYETLGSNLLLISFFVSLARAVEIIVKPAIAYISDKSTFEMGRRKPFMLLGCVFYAVFLIAIFLPPKVSAFSNSVWFGVFYVLFFIADTFCNVPYLALGPELSKNTKEREKLYIIFYSLQYCGVLFASAAPILINRLIHACDCSFCDDILILNKEECVTKCKVFCSLKSNETSLIYICLSIGIFFIASIIILSVFIKEKKGSFNDEKSYFIPALFNLVANKPFIKLIVPWIIDTTISTIFATMLPFFINVIVNPQKYCLTNNIDLDSQSCDTNILLGYCISVFFITCIISMIVWHQLVVHFGKIYCWKAYSISSIVIFNIFFLCKEGSFLLLVFSSFLIAVPAGGAYINEVIISDIIDYDEFQTGKRNEAIYTVFSSFIPKVVSIFAQAIPLSIMSMLGFVNSEGGSVHDQPVIVKDFIQFYFICVPIILAFTSYIFKRSFPISSESMMVDIHHSIKLQRQFYCNYIKSSRQYDFYLITNPVYKSRHIHLFTNTPEEEDSKLIADHFPDKANIKLLFYGKYETLKNRVLWILWTSGGLSAIFLTLLVFTFHLLEVRSMSSIPLISLFIFTISLTIFIMNFLRLSIANSILSCELKVDKEFLRKYTMMSDYKVNEHNLSMMRLSKSSEDEFYAKIN